MIAIEASAAKFLFSSLFLKKLCTSQLEIKTLTTFRMRIPVEIKLSFISSVPFQLQYTIAQIFVLYLNNELTSCSLLLRLLLLRCLLIEFAAVPTCRVNNGVVPNYEDVTVRQVVMKVVL